MNSNSLPSPSRCYAVAATGGAAETREHIRSVLADAGISCAFEGSVVYDILIAPTDTEKATRLLKHEQQQGWNIFFSPDKAD